MAESLLMTLGVAPDFAEAMLGDLAEEYAHRVEQDGVGAARVWCAFEVMRSSPHVIAHAVRHASRHGRARLAACIAAAALVPVVALIALTARNGPPARLIFDDVNSADGVVVNNVRTVQLSMRVLDAAGHLLKSTGVRYTWAAGIPVTVTGAGVITCTRSGDATVRVSLGEVATNVLLRCRPVRDVSAPGMMNLVLGDSARLLPFEALGIDRQPVALMRGRISVSDSTVATLDGQRVRGLAPGMAEVTMRVGDRESFTSVHVYARRRTLEGIRAGGHVAVPVRVGGGEMRRWRLPASRENYVVTMLPDGDEQRMPRLAITGANCVPGFEPHSFMCLAQHDAWLIVYHPQSIDAAQELAGTLAVWRWDHP